MDNLKKIFDYVKENKISSAFWIVLLSLLLLLKIWSYKSDVAEKAAIRSNMQVALGHVVRTNNGGYKSIPSTQFIFKWKDKDCKGWDGGTTLAEFYHKYVYVAFDSTNLENNQLLYNDSCFEEFGLQPPDSIVTKVKPEKNPYLTLAVQK